jgi:hypothetical protein
MLTVTPVTDGYSRDCRRWLVVYLYVGLFAGFADFDEIGLHAIPPDLKIQLLVAGHSCGIRSGRSKNWWKAFLIALSSCLMRTRFQA